MRNIKIPGLLFFAVLAASACGKSNDVKSTPSEMQCKAGATKPADDGCNTCTCNEQGDWGCTEMACEDDVAASCTEGDTKPADDGCNHCVCDANGTWSCTEMGCTP